VAGCHPCAHLEALQVLGEERLGGVCAGGIAKASFTFVADRGGPGALRQGAAAASPSRTIELEAVELLQLQQPPRQRVRQAAERALVLLPGRVVVVEVRHRLSDARRRCCRPCYKAVQTMVLARSRSARRGGQRLAEATVLKRARVGVA
jgi:hypothetical protein